MIRTFRALLRTFIRGESRRILFGFTEFVELDSSTSYETNNSEEDNLVFVFCMFTGVVMVITQ